MLLIGDAVHATTPHLASGAGLGIEDGLVLAEELAAATELGAALERFQQRRWERCRLVVENSLRLGDIERSGGSQQEHADIMRSSMMALVQPVRSVPSLLEQAPRRIDRQPRQPLRH